MSKSMITAELGRHPLRGLSFDHAGRSIGLIAGALLQTAAQLAMAHYAVSAGLPALATCALFSLAAAPALAAGFLLRERAPAGASVLGTAGLLAGPFGSAAILIASLSALVPRPLAEETEASADLALGPAMASPQGRVQRLCSDLHNARLRIEGAASIRPLLDVMLEGSVAARIDALTVMGRNWSPTFRSALQAGRKDPDPSVRVLTSTILARLQTRFAEKITEAARQANERPEAPEVWIALAFAHADSAGSGLVDSQGAKIEDLRQGLKAAERALAIAPNDQRASDLRLRILLELAAAGAPDPAVRA